jgi:hypothetical protein
MRARAVLLAMTTAWAFSADGPAAAEEPTPGSPISPPAEPATFEHPPEIASYTLRATLDSAAHTVHGEGTIRWKNASSRAVKELWFHLYLNAFKNQSSVFMRAPIGGFRGTALPTSWGTIDVKRLELVEASGKTDLKPSIELRRAHDERGGAGRANAVRERSEEHLNEDETDARVPLPHDVAPGETITLGVEWDDKLPSVVERTGFEGSFHMVAQWFPKIAKLEPDGTFAHFPFHHLGEFYADYGTYDVTLDVPEGFVVGATGPVTESRNEGWRHIERHVQADIHDFAWTAWDKYQVRKESIAGVEVTVLVPPHYDDHAERELETMRFALPHFNERYGKYPYSVLTVVHPPATAGEAGGMEYPTLITTGQPSWVPRGIHLVEGVTIHEYGHQYFYGLLASNEDAFPFLDEGVNSYAENEAMTAFKGAGSGIDFLGLRIGDVEAQAERARHFVHDEKVAQGAGAFATGSAYGSLVYSRTAAILETLARAFGRERMDRALATYTRRYRFRHPTPADLIETIRTEIGPAAGEALRVALFEKGWVDFAITQTSSHPSRPPAGVFDRDGKRETVATDSAARTKTPSRFDGYALVVRRGTLALPVEIELVAEDGSRTRVPWDGAAESFRVPYSGSSPLRAAVVDPGEWILLDQHPENNHATMAGRAAKGAPNILERAVFWAETILGGLGP